MAADVQRFWEEGIDFEKWGKGSRCATCGGLMKFKYMMNGNTNVRLEVLPKTNQFAVKDFARTRNRIILHGTIAEMKDKLQQL